MSDAIRHFSVGARLVSADGDQTWVYLDQPLPPDAIAEQRTEFVVVETDGDGMIIGEVASLPPSMTTPYRPLFSRNDVVLHHLRYLVRKLNDHAPGWRVHVHARSDGALEIGSVNRVVTRDESSSPPDRAFDVEDVPHDMRVFDPEDPDVTSEAAQHAASVQALVDERNAELLAREQRTREDLQAATLRAEQQAVRAHEASELADILRGALSKWSPTGL